MKYKLVIFDLDGTVLDTIGDLANAVNVALEMHSFPTHSVEQVRKMVGNGVANLISRATPNGTSDEKCAEVLADFKAYYRDHVNDITKPYDGILALLKALKDAGVKVGINSNKYDAALQNLCRIHFDGLYDYAVGESEVTPKKPDPTAARRIMEAMGAAPEETIYIGDSNVDLNTAANAGIDSAWVSWGFRKLDEMEGCEITRAFDKAEDLQAFLLS
jgi:phosphoglycolate phosphatase